jgi:serine/threonine-protein kinase
MWSRVFLNRYRALRLLGEGGMGRAFLAQEVDSERLVVVKVLHEKYAAASHHREAFRREMDMLSHFRHPGAVEVYEASMDDTNGPCLVMEYVEGETLDVLLRRHATLPAERVGRLLGPLCGVLQAAHAQGIIHRDLKPANIMVVEADTPNERVKVLDFGLARLTVASPQGLYIPMDKFNQAHANAAVGTPEYLYPEELRGEPVDHRSDLYSVGVILYELLTGQRPFDGPTVRDTLSAHVHQPPLPFARLGLESAIPEAVEAVVRACLAKIPAERPQSARDLAERYGKAVGQRVWQEWDSPQPVPPVPALTKPWAETPCDANTMVYHLEAWMPQSVAAVKLRGFLDSVGGEVVESVPGLVRVQLGWRLTAPRQTAARGRWPWAGFRRATEPAAQIEYAHMDVSLDQPAPKQSSQLLLTVRLRPADSDTLKDTPEWRTWCDKLLRNLTAYLMAQVRSAPKPPSSSNLGNSTLQIDPATVGTGDSDRRAMDGAPSAVAQSLV